MMINFFIFYSPSAEDNAFSFLINSYNGSMSISRSEFHSVRAGLVNKLLICLRGA